MMSVLNTSSLMMVGIYNSQFKNIANKGEAKMRKDVDIASAIIKVIIDMEVYSQVSEEIKELFPNKE